MKSKDNFIEWIVIGIIAVTWVAFLILLTSPYKVFSLIPFSIFALIALLIIFANRIWRKEGDLN